VSGFIDRLWLSVFPSIHFNDARVASRRLEAVHPVRSNGICLANIPVMQCIDIGDRVILLSFLRLRTGGSTSMLAALVFVSPSFSSSSSPSLGIAIVIISHAVALSGRPDLPCILSPDDNAT
jgi:hypothetical protein